MKERLENANDEQLDKLLNSLEAKELVKLHRDNRGTITLAKATYSGLQKAGPLEMYKWYPDWLSKNFIF